MDAASGRRTRAWSSPTFLVHDSTSTGTRVEDDSSISSLALFFGAASSLLLLQISVFDMGDAPDPNPFIRFKQLVDRALGRGRSAPVPEFTLFSSADSVREKQRRWLGHILPDSHELCSASPKDCRSTAEYLLRRSWRLHQDTPAAKVDALYREDDPEQRDPFRDPFLAFGGAFYFLPETGDRLPTLQSLFSPPATHPRWLSVDWFKNSPYSPIELEASTTPPFGDSTAWRSAFEDLLADTLDKPRSTVVKCGMRPYGSFQFFPTAPGLDWMLSLQCRGLLPPQIPSYFGSSKCEAYYSACRQGLGPEPDNLDELPGCDVQSDILALATEISKPTGPHSLDYIRMKLRESPFRTVEEVYQQASEDILQMTADTVRDQDKGPRTYRSPSRSSDDLSGADETFYRDSYRRLAQLWAAVTSVMLQHDVNVRSRFAKEQQDEGLDQNDDVEEDDQVYATTQDVSECPHLPPRSERRESFPTVQNVSVVPFSLADLDEDEDGEDGEDEDEDEDGNPNLFACPYLPPVAERVERLPVGHTDAQRTHCEQEAEDDEDDDEGDDSAVDACSYLPPKSDRVERFSQSGMRPSILSSLTVTEKTYHEDGSVTNKVMLRKRFSDGSEDSMESVHTSRAVQEPSSNTAEQDEKQRSWTTWFW